MENPNSDTQWNDVLREKGILPQNDSGKDTFTEDEIVSLVENTIKGKNEIPEKKLEVMTLDELDELEDEEDERVLLEYRKKRIQEMKELSKHSKFGEVSEITAVDYVNEVNKAGEGIWVVLHLYKQGIPLCSLINQFLQQLAKKVPSTKFLKSISTTCVPNYPDRNLPTIFVYFEGNLKQQFVGPHEFGGMNLTQNALEWMLAKAGAMKTELESDPRHKVQDVLMQSLKSNRREDNSSDDDD